MNLNLIQTYIVQVKFLRLKREPCLADIVRNGIENNRNSAITPVHVDVYPNMPSYQLIPFYDHRSSPRQLVNYSFLFKLNFCFFITIADHIRKQK